MMHRIAIGVAAMWLAASAYAFAVSASSPIKVNKCQVTPGTTTVSGFTPGYYPAAGPYYWRDPYGYRYRQYPYSTTVHTSNPTLNIDFVNTGAETVKEVEFGLVSRGDLIAEVRDVGTFSQGAEIKHRFGVDPNVYPTGTARAQCLPMRVTFANGSTWTSPHLPHLNRSLYQQ